MITMPTNPDRPDSQPPDQRAFQTIDDSDSDGCLPRSFLPSALHLALVPERSHGYDLLEQLRLFGLASVDLAGVYRALKRMERDGAVTSEWESSGLGPPRRVYELTPDGRFAAESHLSAMRSARDHLDRLIGSVFADSISSS